MVSTSTPEFTRSIAVVIGINQYQHGIATLQTAVNDAREFARLLKSEHGYQVTLLLDEDASLATLNHLFSQVLPLQVSGDDRVLLYFAGHGMALDSESGPTGYLVPQDAEPGNSNSYLPMETLHEAISALPCRHFLAILDCCFAGAFRWVSTRDVLRVLKVIHRERYDRFIREPAWQVITSAGSDQKALDVLSLQDERGHRGRFSPFAQALFRALKGEADLYPPSQRGTPQGDGVITATELYRTFRTSRVIFTNI
jgi:uncharacterized caspase-like protein